MRTTDLFKFNRSSKRINESLEKTFGTKINFEDFDTAKLEDARNKLRTQIHDARSQSGFNENIENETLTKAQWMHDAIVSELMDRQEHIVDNSVQEGSSEYQDMFDDWMNSEDAPYKDMAGDDNAIMQKAAEYLASRVPDHEISDIAEILTGMYYGEHEDEGGRHELPMPDGDREEGIEQEGAEFGAYDYEKIAQQVFDEHPDLPTDGRGDEFFKVAFPYIVQLAGNKKRANYMLNYDEDFPSDLISAYSWLQKQGSDVGEATGRDAYQRDYDSSVSGMGRRERENDEGDTEPPNNFAVSINGKQWKVFKGRGQYADDRREQAHYQQLKDWAAKKSESTGKKWTVSPTGEPATESINYENKEQTGDNMSNLREGEIQQASAIVTAKTMVDRVGRWIEELSGMENETLLQLGDSIRDEMGQEQARAFIEAVAPAIQAALDNLKQTRDTLSTGVRSLASGEQPADMLGGEPGADMGGEPGADMAAPAEPDAMNAEPADDFGAADAAVGGMEAAGREQRESIDRQSRLMKILAG
jgi:hypothetical protein